MRVDLTHLQPAQRFLVQVLAVAQEGTHTKALARLHHALLGKTVTQIALKEAARDLETTGWLRRGPTLLLLRDAEGIVRDLIDAGLFVPWAQAVDEIVGYRYTPGPAMTERITRRYLVEGKAERFQRYRRMLHHDPVVRWFTQPFEAEHLRAVPTGLRAQLLDELSERQLESAQPIEGLDELIDEVGLEATRQRRALLAGRLPESPATPAIEATAALMQGDPKHAAKLYAQTLTILRKETGDRDALLPGLEGMLAPLALVLAGGATRSKQARAQIKRRQQQRPAPVWRGLDGVLALLDSELQPRPTEHPLGLLVQGLAQAWAHGQLDPRRLQAARDHASQLGWTWVAAELGTVLPERHDTLRHLVPLRSHREAVAPWELQLQQLAEMLSPRKKKRAKQKRVVWTVEWDAEFEALLLEAREQVWSPTKGWSKGRPFSYSRLAGKGQVIPGLSEQDRAICAGLSARKVWTWKGHDFEYTWTPKTWDALVDHPLLFDPEGRAIRVVRVKPRVEVVEREGELILRMVPSPEAGVVVNELPGAGFEVTTFTPEQRNAGRLVGAGLRMPAKARSRLKPVLEQLGHSFHLADEEGPERVLGEPRPVLRIWPKNAGLRVQTGVRPAEGTPLLQAGRGSSTVLGKRGKRSVRVHRDLGRELELMQIFEHRCRSLAAAEYDAHQGYTLPSVEEALELLEELQALGDEVIVEWPEGETMSLSPVSHEQLRLSLRTDEDWFAASGEVQVNEQLVLTLRELLQALPARHGRFIRLDERRFLALTDSLRRQLDALFRAGQPKRDEVKVHALASEILEPLVPEEARDEGWAAWQHKLASLPEQAPVPVTLEAELRDYQLRGFQWLVRLSELGVGACLADDMGLGKTLQALALLLHRASKGPALVVAPTSVCSGWRQEAWRFAPTLRVVVFGEGDRQQQLDDLGESDLLVASYGLLVSEQERLSQQRFATVVLDEAQAIKNPSTQRHKAALALDAEFRLTLSGTPVENRLDELHAQMEFLNPGMLGKAPSFRKRFARPIGEGDTEVSQQLRRIVRPYLLRRTKSAVLEQLPARTEVELLVDPDAQVASFYEALRRNAVEELEASKDAGHIDILSKMTRLRLAACSPRLIEGAPPLEGPKLPAFAEFVEALDEGGHRALVFSQFVRHLALLRERLELDGVPYQYLDGSTPRKARERAVADFQAGHGRVFLISLRAGGTGLNLTGADYVLHMDPWWNPAVEDQASDRAHRIGQTRPVTIYRMITRGTIEQRIVSLHHKKRELAESLVGGQASAAQLSAAELLELLRQPLET